MTKCFAFHDGKCRILTVEKCEGYDKCHFYKPEDYDKKKAVEFVPCPFCGSDNISIRRTGELFFSELFHGVCGDCGATSSVRDTKKKAFNAWNERK